MKKPFLDSKEINNLSELLTSSNKDNVEVGFQILDNYLDLVPRLSKELVLISQLSWDEAQKEKAWQFLEGHFDSTQLQNWSDDFEVFQIHQNLYDHKEFEEDWHWFEKQEAVRPSYMPYLLKNSEYLAEYIAIAETLAESYIIRLDWAERYYLIPLQSNPQDLNILSKLARLYQYGYHDYDKALEYYNKMLAIDKTHYDALEKKGSLLLDCFKDFDASIDVFKNALDYYPNDIIFRIWLADTYMTKNTSESYPLGKKMIQEVISQAPRNGFAWNIYANRLWLSENNPKEAEKTYLQGINLNPTTYSIAGNLAELYELEFQDYEKARTYYLKAFALYSDDTYYLSNFISFLVVKTNEIEDGKDYYQHLRSLTFGPCKREPELTNKQWEDFQKSEVILLEKYPELKEL